VLDLLFKEMNNERRMPYEGKTRWIGL